MDIFGRLGPRRATVKYFDATIAAENVQNAVDPGRVIAVTPFKLHLFERVKEFTGKLRDEVQSLQRHDSERLAQALEELRDDFAGFTGCPLTDVTQTSIDVLDDAIGMAESFQGEKQLMEKQAAVDELEKATSDEGLKLLRVELNEMGSFLASVRSLLTSVAEYRALNPLETAKTLAGKQLAQEALAKVLIPKDSSLDELRALLGAASSVCNLADAAGHVCPLCHRDLDAREVDLFKRYHELLDGELEGEIKILKDKTEDAKRLAMAINNSNRDTWENSTTIPAEIVSTATDVAAVVVSDCDVSKEPTAEGTAAIASLTTSLEAWELILETKKSAINAATKGQETLLDQLKKLRSEVDPLKYAFTARRHLDKLFRAKAIARKAQFWNTSLPVFKQVLRKITDHAKIAHETLVVNDFEGRLNAEYRLLAEKDMSAFGVVLSRRGVDAAVKVIPQIGGQGIKIVMSEGEQRLHALALFFAELESCPQSVFVFDDPISSFDYNYIANYCARLRDFARDHQSRQIIILTHNWEFFVQLQLTLKQSRLDGHLSVQVLENCAVVSEYSEKIDELDQDIRNILSSPGEPNTASREEMAGKMRRLIEAVVNTYVFNKQRHQYKQRSQPLSHFHEFTKVVPLLPTEADKLRDLYAKLSITEHDDPRNAYVNTDKAMFQARYDSIKGVEMAILGRR